MAQVNEYVVLDIEKQADGNTSTYVNLTPHFQGRVGDSRASVDVWFKRNGLPLDLTKRIVKFSGIDPTGHRFHAVGFAAFDQPGADMQAGRVNFYFPDGFFQAEGHWDPNGTYFEITDPQGKVSTLGVDLNVLPNLVEMGINVEPFETDLDRALTQFKSLLQSKASEISQNTQDIDAINNSIKAMNSTVTTYLNMIKEHAVPTKQEMQDYVQKLLSATEWGGDLNLCLTPTTYLVAGSASNNPTKVSGNCIMTVHGTEKLLSQMLIDNEQNLYVRTRSDGRWSDWREQVAWS